MWSPDVPAMTKCIVGGVPNKEDLLDINLPETKSLSVSGAVGQLVVSAVTGISNYG